MLRPMIFVFALCAATSQAQQISTPLENERLDLASCLAAIENLAPTYRTHMARACVETPRKTCLVRGAAAPCLADTIAMVRTSFSNVRSSLPDTIAAGGFAERSYQRALASADAKFSLTISDVSEDALLAEYDRLAPVLVDMFYRARQAGVPVMEK